MCGNIIVIIQILILAQIFYAMNYLQMDYDVSL